MSRYRRVEIFDDLPSLSYFPFSFPVRNPSLFFTETSIVAPKTLAFPSLSSSLFEEELDVGFAMDLLGPSPVAETVTDLIRIDPAPISSGYKRAQRVQRLRTDFLLQSLNEKVSKLESKFDRALGLERRVCNGSGNGGLGDRKYTVTAEIKDGEKNGYDRKYKWIAELKDEKQRKKGGGGGVEKSYKWTAEIKGKGEDSGISRVYTWKASSGGEVESSGSEKKKEKEKKEVKEKETKDVKEKESKCSKKGNEVRLVEIEEQTGQNDHRDVVLRQAFARRFGVLQSNKGKKKELSPQDAAMMIQVTFRAYLIRRSQALRALRELAVAKSKLKEIRVSFNNHAYRRRIACDPEERQRFSEKIIVLLLTVDAIEGADILVRAAKRSMVDELEAMLDVVDPQPPGKTLSMRRRIFDMPDAVIRKELAEGVAQVVQMMGHEENATFEACL